MALSELLYYLQTAIALLVPLLAAISGVFCVVYRRLSSWLTLAALGCFGDCFLGIVERLFWLTIRHSDVPAHNVIQLVSLVETLGYVLAWFLITLGLVLGLGDIARRMTRLREASGEIRDRLPPSEAREAWRPPQEGSRDIQS